MADLTLPLFFHHGNTVYGNGFSAGREGAGTGGISTTSQASRPPPLKLNQVGKEKIKFYSVTAVLMSPNLKSGVDFMLNFGLFQYGISSNDPLLDKIRYFW